MKKNKKKGGLGIVIALLVIALAVVIGVIVFKQIEYGVSAEYYESLRSGAMSIGRARA